MKKLWVALAMMLVLLCWGSAGAQSYWDCEACGEWTVPVEGASIDMGTYHIMQCVACGHTMEREHHLACADKTACRACGSTVDVGEMDVYHEVSVAIVDERYHEESCPCGENAGLQLHTTLCDDPDKTTCIHCGATDIVITNFSHPGAYVEWIDTGASGCQNVCSNCGDIYMELRPHKMSKCEAEEKVCVYCGTDLTQYDIADIDVGHSLVWVNVGKEGCKYECQSCGYTKYEVSLHEVKCNAANSVCGFCGADLSGYQDEEYKVTHDYSWVDIGRTGCQYECAACGHVKEGSYGHWGWCDGDACWNCGVGENIYDASDYQVYHPEWRIWTTNLSATQHGIGCEACGVSVIENHYAYCDGDGGKTCYGCGGTDLEIPTEFIYHDYNASGICNLCGKDKNAAAGLPGDADGNSRVTLNDAIAILEGTVSNDANADVNGDGKTDLNDALRILQYLAGWNVSLQ